MQAVDYTYYTTVYNGTRFSDSNTFDRYEKMAERYINKYGEIDLTTNDGKDCVCAVSESLLDYNTALISSVGKSSESVAGYSVSYSNGYSIKTNLNKQIIDLINLYFGDGSASVIIGVSRHVQ